MPADCEIEVSGRLCGVQAIGRCATCGKAFCLSHQGHAAEYSSATATWQSIGLVDLCLSCLNEQAAKYKAEEEEKARPRREAEEYLLQGTAQAAFRAHGVQTVTLLGVTFKYQKILLGLLPGHVYQDFTPVGRGWVLGEFRWEVSGFDHGDVTHNEVTRLTALVDMVTGETIKYPLLPVDQQPGGYAILPGFWGENAYSTHYHFPSVVEAAQAAKTLLEPQHIP